MSAVTRCHAAIEGARSHLDETLMLDLSGGGDDKIVRAKLARVEFFCLIFVERRDGCGSAFDGAAQCVVWKVCGVEEFAQEFVGRVLDHLHLFKNDFLLTLQIFTVKSRAGRHVCQNGESLRESLVRQLHRKARRLVRGDSIHMPAQPVAFDGYIEGCPTLRAFEDGVLYEMADAIKLWRFVARAASHPDADGGGAKTRHLFGQDGQPVVEPC